MCCRSILADDAAAADRQLLHSRETETISNPPNRMVSITLMMLYLVSKKISIVPITSNVRTHAWSIKCS